MAAVHMRCSLIGGKPNTWPATEYGSLVQHRKRLVPLDCTVQEASVKESCSSLLMVLKIYADQPKERVSTKLLCVTQCPVEAVLGKMSSHEG